MFNIIITVAILTAVALIGMMVFSKAIGYNLFKTGTQNGEFTILAEKRGPAIVLKIGNRDYSKHIQVNIFTSNRLNSTQDWCSFSQVGGVNVYTLLLGHADGELSINRLCSLLVKLDMSDEYSYVKGKRDLDLILIESVLGYGMLPTDKYSSLFTVEMLKQANEAKIFIINELSKKDDKNYHI